MATTNLDINVNVNQALRNIDTLSAKMSGLTSSTQSISKQLGSIGSSLDTVFSSVGAGLSLAAFVKLSDAVTNVNNRLVNISKDAADTTRQFAALAAISIQTRTSFESVSTVYNKMMMASKTLGISQKEAAGYTKTLAQALLLSGASTAEASSTLLQFSQGLSSGVFQGDELKSILENNIVITQALADTMGKSTTEIKKLGSEGKITADVMLKALKNSADEVDASFAKMKPTIAQAFEELKTSSMVAMDVFEKQTGLGEKFARAIEYIAMKLSDFVKWIDAISGKLRFFGELLTILLSFTVVGKIFEVIGGAIGAVVGIVPRAISGFGNFRKALAEMSKEGGTLFTISNKLVAALSLLGETAGKAFKAAGGLIGAGMAYAGFEDVASWFNSLGDASSDTRKELDDFQKKNAEATIEALSDSKTKAEAVTAASKQVTEQISRETAALNKLVAAYKDAVDASMSKFRNDTEALAMNEKQRLSLEQQTTAFDNYKSKIDEIRADIAAKQATGSEADLAMIPKLEQALISLTDTYNKQQEAINGLVEARVAAEAAAAMEQFKVKERIDLENQLIKLQDERATSTMSEIEKKYYDIDAAAKAAAKSQIEAEEARRGPGVRLSAEEAQKYYDTASQGSEQLKRIAEDNYKYSRTFETGWKKAFQSYADNATNAAQQAQKIFQNVTQGLEDMIIKFTKTGKFEWQNFLDSMVEMLLRSQIQQLMANIFGIGMNGQGAGTGGGSGILGLLGFANGGLIPTNGPVLVGERGPEILTGAGGRTVIPNGASAANNVTYNINAVDAMSFKEMLARDPTFLYAVTEQGRRRLPGGR